MALSLVLLDDDIMLLESLKELIPWRELGCEIIGAFSNGSEALEFLENNNASALITDICMPEIDGIKMSKICKERYPDLKIIFLSAYREFEYAQAAIYSGNVVDYITKPVNYNDLKKSINRLLLLVNSSEQENNFSSTTNLDGRLCFFSGLLCGEIKDSEELITLMHQNDILLEPETTVCSLVNFHIKNFSELVKEKNKYNAIQMHHAISNLFLYETDDGFFSLAIYSYGSLVWVILHKNNNIKQVVSDFSQKFIENMKTTLGIDTLFKSTKTYHSMMEFIKNSNFEEIEETGKNSNITAAIEYMKEHFSENITLSDVAKYVYMCPAYFSAYFRKYTRKSFIECLTDIRMKKAAELLSETEEIVSEIAQATGYNHLGNFYEKFKKYYDMTPTEYRKKYSNL